MAARLSRFFFGIFSMQRWRNTREQGLSGSKCPAGRHSLYTVSFQPVQRVVSAYATGRFSLCNGLFQPMQRVVSAYATGRFSLCNGSFQPVQRVVSLLSLPCFIHGSIFMKKFCLVEREVELTSCVLHREFDLFRNLV
jgi:hypothetical protein